MAGTAFGLSVTCLGSESKAYSSIGALKSYASSGGAWQAWTIASFQDSFVLTGGTTPDQFAVTFAIDGIMTAGQNIPGESYWTLFNSMIDGPSRIGFGSASYGDVTIWSQSGGTTNPFSYINGAQQDVLVVGGTTFVTTTVSLPAGTAWFYFTSMLSTFAYSYSAAGSIVSDYYNTATVSNISWLRGGNLITDEVEFYTASGFDYPSGAQATVPEPATTMLLLTGLTGLAAARRRWRS
jgi:hypothetical protein